MLENVAIYAEKNYDQIKDKSSLECNNMFYIFIENDDDRRWPWTCCLVFNRLTKTVCYLLSLNIQQKLSNTLWMYHTNFLSYIWTTFVYMATDCLLQLFFTFTISEECSSDSKFRTNPYLKFNLNKSPTRSNNFPGYYPDIYLQLNMFRAFYLPSSGAQWLQ